MPIKTRQVTQYGATCNDCGRDYVVDDDFLRLSANLAGNDDALRWFDGRDELEESLKKDDWQTEKHDRAYCEACALAREAA